ncbi:DUF4928 family protein [Desulfohalovibrio reitneri]|uniref:DUF4928 family protein n=1 Tax=Desulfohalovibrio reitneri TaxID=1307759 RepID=UPI0004A780D8|nr:DUF4928 family protein [Desulfohalovibrio reitneri]
MNKKLVASLNTFAKERNFKGKGPLCVALVITQHARDKGLPLNPDDLLTVGKGQVLGLGKGAVQNILNKHGINRVLAAEGGRTSRGSINNMRTYVSFLNDLCEQGSVDLDVIERFWIDRVLDFFAGKPFVVKLDTSRSLRHVVRDILQQAIDRQKSSPGMYYSGAVLQHLVGAKLECAIGTKKIEHNSFSTADAPGNRAGDFLIEDVAIHVTTSPSESVIERCKENLDAGYKPILVTLQKGISVADGLAENMNLSDRIDIFEIEQFIALNIYEFGQFAEQGRKTAVNDIVTSYNRIICEVETDPSLKISVK